MTLKRRSVGLAAGSLSCLAFCLAAPSALVACGSDDKADTIIVEGDAGAPAVSYPPALGPDDCAVKTSKITLSQPAGADVWGGLVLIEFEVDGPTIDSFDVQMYDPALGGWSPYYVQQRAFGQRDDGSYFMAVEAVFSEATRDAELKLRVRPSQSGCPEGEWTETSGFTGRDPLAGTKWRAEVAAELFSNEYQVNRTSLPDNETLPSTRLTIGDVTLSVDFGKKGVFTEQVSIPLLAAEDEPFFGCTLDMTFEGNYSLFLRGGYYGVSLALSTAKLTALDMGDCPLPALDDLLISADDADVRLNAYTQNVDIDYLPLLYSEPAAPRWANGNLAQVFNVLGPLLDYESPAERGSISNQLYPQDVVFELQ